MYRVSATWHLHWYGVITSLDTPPHSEAGLSIWIRIKVRNSCSKRKRIITGIGTQVFTVVSPALYHCATPLSQQWVSGVAHSIESLNHDWKLNPRFHPYIWIQLPGGLHWEFFWFINMYFFILLWPEDMRNCIDSSSSCPLIGFATAWRHTFPPSVFWARVMNLRSLQTRVGFMWSQAQRFATEPPL